MAIWEEMRKTLILGFMKPGDLMTERRLFCLALLMSPPFALQIWSLATGKCRRVFLVFLTFGDF